MASPALDEFMRAAAAVYDVARPATFWACRPLFARLIASDFLREFLNAQLAGCLDDSVELVQALNASYGRVPLSCGLQIELLLLDDARDDAGLVSYPADVMLGYRPLASSDRLMLERYRHPAPYHNDIFDPATALDRLADQDLAGLDIATVQAGVELFRIAAVTGPIALVLLQSKTRLDFSWTYDRASLRPVQAVSPDVPAFRLYYAARLLGAIRAEGSLDSLLRMAAHRSHFVRWAALQGLFELDHGIAVERLVAATADRHPSIRKAATAALARLAVQPRTPP